MNNSFTAITALDFLKQLAEEKVEINVCHINKKSADNLGLNQLGVRNFKELYKQSSSPTQIFFGELVSGALRNDLELPVSFKIFRNITDENNESFYDIQGLKYEARLYKQIMDDIIDKNLSPNFVSYVAFGCCEVPNACFLITEKVGSGAYFGQPKLFPVYTLSSVFDRMTSADQSKVLFQIIYALALLNIFKIVHNDLHTGNVLVMILDAPVKLKFIVKEISYLIETKYIPYLYDWDLSYSEQLGENEKLHSLQEFNITNTLDSYRDLYTLFCYLFTRSARIPPSVKIYSSSHTLRTKENKSLKMHINYKEMKKLIASQPVVQTDNTIYKLSRAQFVDAVRDANKRGLPDDMKTIYFFVYGTGQLDSYILEIWNPFECRMTAVSSNFKTPLELLKTEFKEFVSNEDAPYTYDLPNVETPVHEPEDNLEIVLDEPLPARFAKYLYNAQKD